MKRIRTPEIYIELDLKEETLSILQHFIDNDMCFVFRKNVNNLYIGIYMKSLTLHLLTWTDNVRMIEQQFSHPLVKIIRHTLLSIGLEDKKNNRKSIYILSVDAA